MILFFFIWCIACTYVYAADDSSDESSRDDTTYTVRFLSSAKTVAITKGNFPYLDNLEQGTGVVNLKKDEDKYIDPEFLHQLNGFVTDYPLDMDIMQRILSDHFRRSLKVPEYTFERSSSYPRMKYFLDTVKKNEIFQIPSVFELWLSALDRLKMPAKRDDAIRQVVWNMWGSVFLEKKIPHDVTQGSVTLKSSLEQRLAQTIIKLEFEEKFKIDNQGYLKRVADLLETIQDEKTQPFLYKTCSKDCVSLLCKKENIYTLVVIPSFRLNRYYAYALTDKNSSINMHHGDVSYDGAYLVTFLQTKDDKYIAWYECIKGAYNKVTENIASQRIKLPDNVDMTTARVAFEMGNYSCYCTYVRDGVKIYVEINAKTFTAIEHTSKQNDPWILRQITDPWIIKVLNNENVSHECRGGVQVNPFFNKKGLHHDFFRATERVKLTLGQLSCTGLSCTHYELQQEKGKNIVRRIDFDPDSRIDPLLEFLNKKYKSVKNVTGDSVALYPNALAIAHVYISDWKIMLESLQQKMGILYTYVDADLKQLIAAQLKPFSFNAAKYWLYTKSQSFVSSARKMGVAGSIKYALGTLGLGAMIAGSGYLVYNLLKSGTKLPSKPLVSRSAQ